MLAILEAKGAASNEKAPATGHRSTVAKAALANAMKQ
jgi:hypothetical protein